MSLSPLIDRGCATLRRLTVERDPVLMQGREGRWRWPWVIAGMAIASGIVILLFATVFAPVGPKNLREWLLLSWDSPELDPRSPQTFALWLVLFAPLLVAPLLTLPLVHDVS